MDIEISALKDLETLKSRWQSLENESESSPFISWLWIGSWLEEIALTVFPPHVIKVTENNCIIALGLLHRGTVFRRKFFRRQVLFVNELPVNDNNMVSEYNGLLIKKGYEDRVWTMFFEEIQNHPDWDELQLNFLTEDTGKNIKERLNITSHPFFIQQACETEVFFADFLKAESWFGIGNQLLSSNKRAQIKRSIRAYQTKYNGEVTCEKAGSVQQGLNFFSKLEELHSAYWTEKGHVGAFANKKWVHFNKRIIEKGLLSGNVHLYRIAVADHVIGYLYNLNWNNVEYNIQSGFHYEVDNKLKPGYVSHWLAMQNCYEFGSQKYNFLVGSNHYKKSLSNRKEMMISITVRKKSDSMKFLLEDTLSYVFGIIRKYFGR